MKSEERSQLKTGVILNYINLALGSFIPLFYTPVMLRILGQNEYGLYKLSGSITGYLGLLSMGIGSAINRNLIKARIESGHDEEQRVFSLFVMLYRIIAIFTLIAGTILVFNLEIWYEDSIPEESMLKMKVLVLIMVCQSALSMIMGPYYSLITSHERFIFAQIVGIFFTCFTPALNLLALFLGYASIGLAVSSFISSCICQIVYMAYATRKLDIKVQWNGIPWYLSKEIFSFSFWLFLGELTSILYNSTDNLMIGSRSELGTKAVAVYSIGCVLTTMIFSFTTGISSVLAPRINRMCFEGVSNEELNNFAIKIGRIQLLIVSFVVSGFVALGVPFISFYAGDGYDEAYWVTILTIMPLIISLVQNVYLNISMARYQHQFRSIVYLIIAVLNVFGTWLILPYWGIIGAALITGIAGVIGRGFVMNWYYEKKMSMNTYKFWKSLYKICILPIILCLVSCPFFSHFHFDFWTLFVVIAIYSIFLGLMQYRFVMDDYEKGIFLNFVNRIKNIKLCKPQKLSQK